MLFIWEDILYMAYFQSTRVFSHMICFKVDKQVSRYKFYFCFHMLGRRLYSILPFPRLLVPLYRRDLDSFGFYYT